jgi:hypothetical protein
LANSLTAAKLVPADVAPVVTQLEILGLTPVNAAILYTTLSTLYPALGVIPLDDPTVVLKIAGAALPIVFQTGGNILIGATTLNVQTLTSAVISGETVALTNTGIQAGTLVVGTANDCLTLGSPNIPYGPIFASINVVAISNLPLCNV